ncbi:MAG: family 10 glycosylhydrolase [Lewinellaceae bacterium]|nr:family 10 glycosylhydrolase [Saprospiraceae bacterium]MCB9340521.1 family 10 glycosylhydrolase [Lewinellaceae bacterium]
MRKALFPVILSCFATIFFIQIPQAQEVFPKREFRGAWIATVANIDFPTTPSLDKSRFSEEWKANMDLLQGAGFNAVLAQVRPAGDAFYKSKIAPWSKYLTGKQGDAPNEGFDPLTFMVASAHQHNMEFHAWLNPYRASMDTITATLAGYHPYKHHPEWFIRYGGKLYFNPALPDVRNYITEIVMEIVMEYNVDAIHFDDYFYPYPSGGELFPDAADFAKYGLGYGSIDDWRRSNVDKLISQVSTMLKTMAPQVKFGVSPFGVWRNADKDPQLGSATKAGINTYDDLFADVRSWLEKGWIDYVAPQLYWNIGFPIADYEVLLNWWKNNAYDRNVYAGIAVYKVGTNPEPAWSKRDEVPRQVRLNRSTPGVEGSIFYNTSSLKKNPLGVLDSLRNHYFSVPALLPELAYMELPASAPPTMSRPKYKKGTLSFNVSLPATEENASYLVIYRFEDRLPGDYNNPENIFKILPLNGLKKITVEDKEVQQSKSYTYVASAMNRQHTESLLSKWHAVLIKKNRAKRLK